MRLVDTRYLLRYLLQDDEAMYQKACEAIKAGASTRLESIPEVVYVLAKAFDVSRKETAEAVAELLDDVEIPERETVQDALAIFAETSLDYVDCVYVAVSKRNNERVLTFDRKTNSRMDKIGIPRG